MTAKPSIEPTDHFAHWITEAEAEEQAASEQAQQEYYEQSNMIGREEFHALFCTAFCTGSYLTGLQSLMVDSSDGGAKACTSALYDTILDVPALHFLLMPQGKWLERVIAIGTFAVPMSLAVSAEMKAKRAAKGKKPMQQSTGAAGNVPPEEFTSLREMAAEQDL